MSTTKPTCSIEGCDRSMIARGWCPKHYDRWYKHGDPLREPPTAEALFWAKVDKRGPDECWLWTASCLPNGYGGFRTSGYQYAHRFAYELLIGPIPEGLVIDHVKTRGCTSRACVNPAHLEAVTQGENVRRGAWAQKTHCVHGHPYTPENTLRSARGRMCRECNRLKCRRRAAAQKTLRATLSR